MRLVFSNQASRCARIPRAALCDMALRAQNLFIRKTKGKSVAVVFLSESKSKWLNQKYTGKPRAANVLSFESKESGELGDIMICPSEARRESKKMGVGFNWWIGFLFAHGLLHLIGFDHKSESQERKMEALTRKILCG